MRKLVYKQENTNINISITIILIYILDWLIAMCRRYFLFTSLIFFFVLTFNTVDAFANKPLPISHEKAEESTKKINDYLSKKKHNKELGNTLNTLAFVFIMVIILIFTVVVILSKQTVKQKVFRLCAWYPLFSISLVYINIKLYPLPLLFVPIAIMLWFQKHITKKEVAISTIPFLLLVTAGYFFFLLLSAISNQGAGQGAGH